MNTWARVQHLACGLLAALVLAIVPRVWATGISSQLVDGEITSSAISQNRIGSNPVRRLTAYLPADYASGNRSYPVVYFLPTPFRDYRDLFNHEGAKALFDRAIATGGIAPFVLVSVDMNTPLGCSWYVNSPVTGHWEDFLIQELVPYVDRHFRTLSNRDSRGICGDFMGGYGAIRMGMKHPDVFGSVYALHPVGTGSGILTMDFRPNWDLLASATSLDDIKKDGFTQLFTAIFQAHVPDLDRPPLFIDLAARNVNGKRVIDTAITNRLRNNFLLETMIPQYADNLRSLRGFKFDWGRSDPIQDHVYSNQAFTHKLNEFGVPHEAEEYNGVGADHNWGEDGRVATDVLPFFQRHLVFAP